MYLRKSFLEISGIFMLILVFSSVQQSQGSLVWSENFNTENPTGWMFGSWIRPLMYNFTANYDEEMSVIDGILRAPNSTTFQTITYAAYNSSVAYGSWSFDYIVFPGSDRLAYDVVTVLFTDLVNNYSMEGLSETQYLTDCTGYSILIVSGHNTAGISGIAIPGISFAVYTPWFTVLETYEMPDGISGIHHINITRGLQGLFSIYFDSELIIQFRHKLTTSSERFQFVSFKGDSGIDNITVNDEPVEIPTTTTTTVSTTTEPSEPIRGFSDWVLFPPILILIIWRKRSLKDKA